MTDLIAKYDRVDQMVNFKMQMASKGEAAEKKCKKMTFIISAGILTLTLAIVAFYGLVMTFELQNHLKQVLRINDPPSLFLF